MTAPGRYQAGTAFVPVVPSLKGFQQKVRSELSSFDARLVVPVDLDVDWEPLRQVESALSRMSRQSADVRVGADTAVALSQLQAVASEVARLDGQRAEVTVDVDDRGTAGGAASGLGSVFSAGMKLGALVPVIAGVGAALAGLGGAAVVGVGALGVAALALNGVGGAYSALGDAELAAGDDAAGSAKAQAAAAAAVTSAQDRVKSSASALANTRAQAADAQIRAEQRVAQAESGLVRAQRDALRAQQDLNDARREAQRSLEDLTFRVQDGALAQRQAVLDLADAEQALAAARSDPGASTKQVERAQIAYGQAANQLERLRVENTRLAADKATADSAGVEGSEQVVHAQDQVQSSTERVAAAQQAMADAVREQAAQQRQAVYSVEQAQQGVVEAQRALQQALANTGDVGSSSARKVRDAFAELTPVQAQFTTFLFGLRPIFDDLKGAAADGFLPGLQAGLEALVPLAPVITQVVGQLAGALGGLAQQALEALASPYWVDFFTMLGQVAGPLMEQFGGLLGQVAMLAGDLIKAFLPLAPIAFDVIGALADGLRVLAPFLGQVAEVLLQGLLVAFQALAPAMGPVGEALVALAEPVGALAGELGQVLAAALVAIVPIFTELAPPLTDLIGLLGDALLGAIGALAPTIADLAPLFGQVLTDVVKALSQALELVLPYLDDIAGVIGDALVGAVRTLLPVLPQLTDAWLTVVRSMLPLIPAVVRLAESLLPALLGLIPVLTPVIMEVATAFAEIMPSLAPVIVSLVEGLVPVIESLTPLVITLAKIFTDVLSLAFTGVIVPLLQYVVVPVLRILADTLTWLWKTIAVPVFEGIGAIVAWTYDNVLKPGFDAIKGAVDTVGEAFESGVDFIGEAWGKLRKIAADPINFVIETVYNNGLREVWNKIAEFVGLDPLPKIDLVKFAGGGVLGGYAPGQDKVLSLLSPGEAVLVPELVRAIGPTNILAANAAASGGRPATITGFSGGGIARFAGGGVVDTVLGFVGGIGEDITDLFRDPIGWIKTHIGIPDSPWIDMVAKTPAKLLGDTFDWLAEKLSPFTSSDQVVVGGPASNEQLNGWIRAAMQLTGVDATWFPALLTLIMRESGGNPNVRNDWDINAQNGVPSQGLMQTIPPTFAAYRDPRLPNNILDPVANIVAGINYIKSRYGSIWNVQQANPNAPPMGYAGGGLVFDQGGWLPPGPTPVYNGTGRPEPILTSRQWEQIRMASNGLGEVRIAGELSISDDGLTAYIDGRIDNYDQDSADALLRGTRI